MVDEGAQVGPRALAFATVEDKAFEPGVDEVFIQRGVVLEIHFGAAARDLIERRLGDVEVPGSDQLGHLAVEERQQQRADVRPVDVGVGHDDDLVVAKFLEVEFLAPDRSAKRLDHRPDLFRAQHAVESCALDVEYLALEWEDGLDFAIATLLGRAAGAVALDQE